MRIRLNEIDFEVEGVTVAERAAILADPMVAPAMWREVFKWDHKTSTGEIATKGATDKGQIILPNGILFYLPKTGSAAKAEGPSQAMAKRVLEALKAKSAVDLMRAVASVVQTPKMVLPREPYAPIEGAVSYALRMFTDFNVLRLRNAGRNLSFVVALPGQCIYRHEITDRDEAAYDALLAETPELANIQPRFIIAPTSDANRNMRILALSTQLRELQETIKVKIAETEKFEDRELTGAYHRALTEFQVLTKKADVKPAPAVART